MPEPLNKLERRILDFLVDYLRRNTFQPSIREIGRRFDIKSTKTVSEYLQALADKGWIERDPSRSRGVKLLGVDLSPDTVTVPCLEAEAATDLGELEIDRKLAGGSGAFCVIAGRGDAESAGARAGDMLLAEPITADELEDGDLAVVRVRGEILVLQHFRRSGVSMLEPASADYPPTLVAARDVALLGRVVSMVRRFRAPVGSAVAATPGAGRG